MKMLSRFCFTALLSVVILAGCGGGGGGGTTTTTPPPQQAQTWSIVATDTGQTATATVDGSGNFTGSGWTGEGSLYSYCLSWSIPISAGVASHINPAKVL